MSTISRNKELSRFFRENLCILKFKIRQLEIHLSSTFEYVLIYILNTFSSTNLNSCNLHHYKLSFIYIQ